MEASLGDLPPNILSEILARLPIKSLLVCRSVCKTFLNITSSNPYFISLHSSNSSQILICQSENDSEPSKFVHLVDSQHDAGFGFNDKFQMKHMFQIPKYPGKYSKNYPEFGDGNNFILVNSYNGLLFFAERNLYERSFICNPITKEYVTLVERNGRRSKRQQKLGMWFGFSPGENQYKVLRIFSSVSGRPREGGSTREYLAQIHVVGSSTWRDIEDKPPSKHLAELDFALVNGSIYWLCIGHERSKFIIFFDFEKEKFGEIGHPVEFVQDWHYKRHCLRIGVLRDRLCLSVYFQSHDIFFMDTNCSQRSWTKEWALGALYFKGNPLRGPLTPLKILSNGKMLMLWFGFAPVCCDPETKIVEVVQIYGFSRLCKSCLLSPSFVPLKEALMADNVTVHNLE